MTRKSALTWAVVVVPLEACSPAWKSAAASTAGALPSGANVAPSMNPSTSHFPFRGWRYTWKTNCPSFRL
jgi:hypothetical protein